MIDINKKNKIKKYLPIIKDEINRTLLIINDFSDYGKLKIEKEYVNMKKVETYMRNLLLNVQVGIMLGLILCMVVTTFVHIALYLM